MPWREDLRQVVHGQFAAPSSPSHPPSPDCADRLLFRCHRSGRQSHRSGSLPAVTLAANSQDLCAPDQHSRPSWQRRGTPGTEFHTSFCPPGMPRSLPQELLPEQEQSARILLAGGHPLPKCWQAGLPRAFVLCIELIHPSLFRCGEVVLDTPIIFFLNFLFFSLFSLSF